jgi:Bacterial Ig domain
MIAMRAFLPGAGSLRTSRWRTQSIGVVALLIAASACTRQDLTQSQCLVGHGSGFVGTTGNQEHITVAENGSPCAIDLAGERRGSGQFGLAGQIATPPAHGTASVDSTAYATQIVYTPAPDFVGNDSFVVAFGPHFTATVLVQVVPVADHAASPR